MGKDANVQRVALSAADIGPYLGEALTCDISLTLVVVQLRRIAEPCEYWVDAHRWLLHPGLPPVAGHAAYAASSDSSSCFS